MSEENIVSNETVVDNDTENKLDSAQSELIAESKKYRKRAQDAENKITELQQKFEAQENAELKQKEEYKTLAEKYEAQVNELNPFKEKYENIVSKRKTTLLEKLPEDKREQFKNKELDVLEFMVSELSSKPSAEPNARGTVKAPEKEIGDWTKLGKDDKKSNWTKIVNSYTKK